MISDQDIKNLRAMLPDLLRERCGITDVSRAFRCPSPDHEDRNPSAHYYENDRMVHCFGCSRSWDVFSLVRDLDGVEGFVEQAHAVADIVGYHLDDPMYYERLAERERRKAKRKPKPKTSLELLCEVGGADCSNACGRAFDALYRRGNEAGRAYMLERGFDDDDLAGYGLGFVRNPKDIMPEFSVYEPNALGFIVIPFWNEDFTKANYCMLRTIPGTGKVNNKEWRPKGLATPLWREWLLTQRLSEVYVTEGLLDAMALAKKIEFSFVMALGGISNAKRLSKVLATAGPRRRPKKIVVCMDEDDKGRETSERICRDLDGLGIAHAVLPAYPNGAKDANEWLMNGRGVEWEFEGRDALPLGTPLYRTRWLHGC